MPAPPDSERPPAVEPGVGQSAWSGAGAKAKRITTTVMRRCISKERDDLIDRLCRFEALIDRPLPGCGCWQCHAWRDAQLARTAS
jgi:hypothetical protein